MGLGANHGRFKGVPVVCSHSRRLPQEEYDVLDVLVNLPNTFEKGMKMGIPKEPALDLSASKMSPMDQQSLQKYLRMVDDFFLQYGRLPAIMFPKGNRTDDEFMYLENITINEELTDRSAITAQVKYQGVKRSNDGREILPHYVDFPWCFKDKSNDFERSQKSWQTAMEVKKVPKDKQPRSSAQEQDLDPNVYIFPNNDEMYDAIARAKANSNFLPKGQKIKCDWCEKGKLFLFPF